MLNPDFKEMLSDLSAAASEVFDCFPGKGTNVRFRIAPAIMLSTVCIAGAVNGRVLAQQWSVFLDDVYIEDPDGILDRTRAESVEFMPDGRTLVDAGFFYNSATRDSVGEVRLRNAADGSLTATLRGTAGSYGNRAGALAVSSSGRRIAAAGRTKDTVAMVDIFDPVARKLVRTLQGNASSITCVAFSPDGKVLAVACLNGTVELWDPERGALTSSWGVQGGVWPVTFSPDGNVLATGNGNGSISFWEPTNAERIGHVPAENIGFLGTVVFSADGKLVAGGGWPVHDGNSPIHLWEVTAGSRGRNTVTLKKKATFAGHREHTYSLAFSPDGKLLASANQDMTVKIWDVVLEKEVTTIKDHEDFVYDVAFSADGKALATLGRDALKLWKSESFGQAE